MNTARRITVIMERGKIVGTQVAPQPSTGAPPAASALLRPGPGQRSIEVVAPMPARFASAKEIELFHATLLPLVKKTRR